MGLKRRDFLKTLGVAGGGLLGADALAAPKATAEKKEMYSLLIDISLCEGCQSCEYACAEINNLPDPEGYPEVGEIRKLDPDRFTVLNAFDTSKGEYYVKKQCMHCNQPACASACLTKAMYKTEEGPVIWRGDKCMGCRYCMLSCPFDIPTFEYDSPNPRIAKCRMCFEQLAEGEWPACVDNCPNEAVIFGTRREMLAEARRRIAVNPGDYVDQIYGEHEAGGTGVLYISPVPFEELGFDTEIEREPYPEYTKGFLYAVPSIFVLWPAILLGLRESSARKEQPVEGEVDHE